MIKTFPFFPTYYRTSRDRPKSAPYPRLKNSKKRLPSVKYSLLQYSKIENFSEIFRKNYILKKMDRMARRGPLARAPGALKSHNAEKLKGGTLWGFSTSILSQNIKKLKGGNFYFRKKISVPKKMKGYVTRENRKNLFGSVR